MSQSLPCAHDCHFSALTSLSLISIHREFVVFKCFSSSSCFSLFHYPLSHTHTRAYTLIHHLWLHMSLSPDCSATVAALWKIAKCMCRRRFASSRCRACFGCCYRKLKNQHACAGRSGGGSGTSCDRLWHYLWCCWRLWWRRIRGKQ